MKTHENTKHRRQGTEAMVQQLANLYLGAFSQSDMEISLSWEIIYGNHGKKHGKHMEIRWEIIYDGKTL